MSADNLASAKLLFDAGQLRTSMTRSYYASYCAATAILVDTRAAFPNGWNNPAHEQLPALIENLGGLPPLTRRNVKRALRRLRMAREDADYRPRVFIDRQRALNCLHDATDVIRLLRTKT